MEKINTNLTKDEFEEFRLNFSRGTITSLVPRDFPLGTREKSLGTRLAQSHVCYGSCRGKT